MVDTLTEEQIQEFKEAFSAFDKNETGTIPTKDFKAVMNSLGQNPYEDELQRMINEMDKDGKGTIEFVAYLTLMARLMNESCEGEQDLTEPFRAYDKDGNGLISTEDLIKVLKEMGEALSDEEVEEMMREANPDENGKVNYEDFIKLMLSK